MIFEEALGDWIVDRSRQRRSEKAIADFARDWNESVSHRRIEAAMAVLADPTAEQVAETVCRLFDDGSWVTILISSLAEAMRKDPFFVPPFRHINSDVHKGLIVYEDERVAIAAGVSGAAHLAAKKDAPRGATSIGFTGQLSVLKFLKAGNARLSFWEAPQIDAGFRAAEAGRCSKVTERTIGDGETVIVDGRRESFVIEHAQGNIFIIQATVKLDQAPLSVEYDSTHFGFVGCSAADDSASRIQMITTLLRKLDHAAAFPVIAAFLDNPNFFVRWHVMRELLGLDAGAALPLLKRMAAGDPHAEVRRLASGVLGAIEVGQPDLKKAA